MFDFVKHVLIVPTWEHGSGFVPKFVESYGFCVGFDVDEAAIWSVV